MGKHSILMMITYVLLATCLFIHKTSAFEGTDSESVSDSNQRLSKYLLVRVYNLLKDNQHLLQNIVLHDSDITEDPRLKRQSLAGLDNLDFMTKMLAMPMSSGSSLSDRQKLMLKMGRKK